MSRKPRGPLTTAEVPAETAHLFDFNNQTTVLKAADYGDHKVYLVNRTCKTCSKVETLSTRSLRGKLRVGRFTGDCQECGRRNHSKARAYATGSDHAMWNGGRVPDCNGYIKLLKPEHPMAGAQGYILEHRWVMEQVIGRPVAPGETVHHKNGRRDDNRPENLELWTGAHPKGIRYKDLEVEQLDTLIAELVALRASKLSK